MISLRQLLKAAQNRAIVHQSGLLLLVSSFLLALSVFYPQLQAGLWIADDHQILDFVSQVGRTPSGYITVITHPSDFPLASEARLRPVYWPIRISEIFIWYDNAFGWHFARLLMITAFLALIAQSMRELTNSIFAILIIFLVVQLDSVAGVWTRLGNAEAYAAIGVAAILWASTSLMKSATERTRASITSLVAMNLGVLLAVGSKENFFPFALFLIATPGYAIWQRLRTPSIVVSWLAASVITAVMAKHLVKTLASRSPDGQSTLANLFGQVFDGITILLPFLWFPLLLFAAAVVASSIVSSTRFTRPLSLDNVLFVGTCAILTACCISQPTFHSGDWPANDIYSRYNFVGWFCAFMIGALASAILYRSVLITRTNNPVARLSEAHKVVACTVICSAFLLYQHPPIFDQAQIKLNRTNLTDRNLSSVTQLTAEQNFDFLTIEVQGSRDYEASISTIIHLRHRGVTVPIYVRVIPETDPQNQPWLLNRLRNFSNEGKRGFSPIQEMNASSSKCLSIFFFSASSNNSRCEKFVFSY